MNTQTGIASFTQTARAMVAANDAAREAHIAALVAGTDWPALEADAARVAP